MLDVLRLGRAPAAGDAGARARRRSAPRSTWPGRCRRRRGRVRQRGAAQGRAGSDLDAWLRPVAPTWATTAADALARRALRIPRWIVEALRDVAGRRRRRPSAGGRCWPPTTCPRRSRWSPGRPPGVRAARGRGGIAGPLVAVRRRSCDGRRPRRTSPRCADGAPACRTRAASWSRWPRPPRRSTAPTAAGWTCAPARAARPPCSPRSPAERGAGSRRRAARRTAPGWSRRAARRARRRRVASPTGGAGRRGSRGSFDRVLVDAPCTGLGALRRRPEARWRRQPADLDGAGAAAAARCCRAALEAVRPGGVVVYATCSPVSRRDPRVVAAVLADRRCRADRRTPLLLGDVPDLGDGPDAQLWPHLHGTDAMYLAALRRAS